MALKCLPNCKEGENGPLFNCENPHLSVESPPLKRLRGVIPSKNVMILLFLCALMPLYSGDAAECCEYGVSVLQ